MNYSQQILNKMDQYFKDSNVGLEEDVITSQLIRQYFEEEDLKKHWLKILEDKSINQVKDSNTIKDVPSKSKVKILLLAGFVMATAASLLLFFAIPQNNDSLIGQLLETQYEKPYHRDLLKGEINDIDIRTTAYDAYQNKDYNESAKMFEQAILLEDQQESDYFFLGLSYLYNNKPKQAITHFEFILDQESSMYEDSATWFLGLALLDAGYQKQSIEYLSKVATWDGNTGKRNLAMEAQKLLEAID